MVSAQAKSDADLLYIFVGHPVAPAFLPESLPFQALFLLTIASPKVNNLG